jgi:hypothetical protein
MGRFYSCSVVDDPHLRPRGVTLRRSPDEWQFLAVCLQVGVTRKDPTQAVVHEVRHGVLPNALPAPEARQEVEHRLEDEFGELAFIWTEANGEQWIAEILPPDGSGPAEVLPPDGSGPANVREPRRPIPGSPPTGAELEER